MRIVSTSDVPGGNHSLSLRRRDVVVGDRRLSLIEKMPTIESAARVALNARELWLYERYFRGRRLGFLPEFYGSCSEGSLIQMVFEHVAGARPDLKLPRASGLVLAALGEINAVSLPEEIPFESWALPFMDPERIRKRAASMSKDHDLGDFPRNLPLHDARYRGLKRGLGHGDLHDGNILVDDRDRVFLIDWTRWGAHPVGSDFGKYMLGAAYRGRAISDPGASPRLRGRSRRRARRRGLLGALHADRLPSVHGRKAGETLAAAGSRARSCIMSQGSAPVSRS